MEAWRAWHEFYILLGTAAAALSAVITIRVAHDVYDDAVVTDAFAYGALPALGYAAMLAAAVIPWRYSPEMLAGAVLLLPLVNIRNAWDLMLTMVRRHAQPGAS